jgi:hypothetical protein
MYRHEINAIKLQEIPFFVSLLEDIRNHFLISNLTRLIYASIAEQFLFALDPAVRGKLKKSPLIETLRLRLLQLAYF